MPTVIQTNFTAGEVSPLLHGRVDLARYQNGCARLRNMIVMPQGGATRRTGTILVATPKYQDRPCRLVRFLFGDNQAFVLEIGDQYTRFYTNDGQVFDGPNPYEIATPWGVADLARLSFAQSADILYVTHPLHAPRELRRISNTNWQIAIFASEDGPYLSVPKKPRATLTPTAAAAVTTLTASATDGINSGAGFLASDVGRHIRTRVRVWRLKSIDGIDAAGTGYELAEQVTLAGGTPVVDPDGITERPAKVSITEHSSGVVSKVSIIDYGAYLAPPASPAAQDESNGTGTGLSLDVTFTREKGPVRWLWGTIAAVNSPTSIDVTMDEAFISTDAIDTWRLGAWGPTTQFPSAAAFFQQRLYFGGADGTAWGSEIGDYPSFSPTLPNGQVVDSNAVTFTLDDTEVNTVVWLSPAGAAQIPQLGIGTAGAEHVLSSSDGGAVTPTTPQAYPETRYGSKPGSRALRIGKAVLFVGEDGTQLYEWSYVFQAGGYIGQPIEIMSEHLALPGIAQIDYARQPYSIVWSRLENGGLAGLTYLREQEIAGWHGHALGGSYFGAAPIVESHACIPAPDRSYDELWLSVLRRVNDQDLRTIERVSRPFRDLPLDEAVFVDCAISSALTKPATVCRITGQNIPQPGDTATVVFGASVASASDATLGTYLRVNGGLFRITAYYGPSLVGALCYRAPDSIAPAASGEWSYTVPATMFSGLDALEGEEVAILGDGAVYPRQTVTGGQITLPYPASYVTVGLPYNSELETLPLEMPAGDGTSQGRTARIDHLYLRLFETLGGEYGPEREITDILRPRSTADPLGAPPPLFTGDVRLTFPGGHNAEHRVYIRQSDPLPLTVLAIVAKGRTYEQGA